MERLFQPRLAYGLAIALYLLAFPYHPQIRSPNELCRLWQSRSLIDHGKLSINETIAEFGMVGDLSIKDGILYPSKAPLMSFAAAPLYAVLKLFGPVSDTSQVFWSRLFFTIAPGLVLLVFLRRFLKEYLSEALTDSLVLTYALGSMAFNYSEMFLSHQVTAVLMFMAFYAAWRTLRGDWKVWGWVVSGAFAGAVVACEYTGALSVVCLALYVAFALWKKEGLKSLPKVAGLVLLGSAPFLGGLMAYHQACFGHPLTSGYKYLNDPGYQGWHLGGFLGIRYPDPRAFFLSFFSPLRGFFTLSPFLLLAFGSVRTLFKEHREYFVLFAVMVLGNAYFTSSFTYDSWGWAVGPRHLTPLVPFLLLPAGLTLKALSEAPSLEGRIGYGLAIGLCVASVVMAGTLTFINYVPESHSTSIFGLAWPLFKDGFLPPTSLLFLDIPNPYSGVLALVLVYGAALLVALRLGKTHPRAVLAAAALTVVAHLGILSGLTEHHPADVANVKFFEERWIAPKGVTLSLRAQNPSR